MIVDDEPSQRKVISAALKQKGCQTFEASDGLEGLEAARTQMPDLIITDVFMENMNGFIMVETLREDPETAGIPVVMMTSAAQGAGAWQSMEDVEYIEKGFAMAALVQLVEKLLNTKRS